METLEQTFKNPSVVCRSQAIAASLFFITVVNPGDSKANQENFFSVIKAEVGQQKSKISRGILQQQGPAK